MPKPVFRSSKPAKPVDKASGQRRNERLQAERDRFGNKTKSGNVHKPSWYRDC